MLGNVQCQCVLLICMIARQAPSCLRQMRVIYYISLVYCFYFLSPSPWQLVKYRPKYCLKGPLSPLPPASYPQRRELKAGGCLKDCASNYCSDKAEANSETFQHMFWITGENDALVYINGISVSLLVTDLNSRVRKKNTRLRDEMLIKVSEHLL